MSGCFGKAGVEERVDVGLDGCWRGGGLRIGEEGGAVTSSNERKEQRDEGVKRTKREGRVGRGEGESVSCSGRLGALERGGKGGRVKDREVLVLS